ncbi:hypothetical protein DFH09DRAFT_1079766 [Mycena vulgaris]|nr:hypothetical protein DFH09DRAFT_1079766 [Mycena vulgaris]
MAHGTLAGETAHSRSEAAHSDQCAAFEPEAALSLFEHVPPSVKPSVTRSRNRHVSFVPSPFSLSYCHHPPHTTRKHFEKARQNGSLRIKAHRRRHGLPGWRLGMEADGFSECSHTELQVRPSRARDVRRLLLTTIIDASESDGIVIEPPFERRGAPEPIPLLPGVFNPAGTHVLSHIPSTQWKNTMYSTTTCLDAIQSVSFIMPISDINEPATQALIISPAADFLNAIG